MKRFLILLFASLSLNAGHTYEEEGEEIFLTVNYTPPHPSSSPIKRLPQIKPSVYISNHTLTFRNLNEGYMLSLFNAENHQELSTFIMPEDLYYHLPIDLKGQYIIILSTESFCYRGYVLL